MATGDKIKRKMLATYLDSNFGTNSTSAYVLLGKGLENLSTEMGANVNKTNDVTGETDTFIDKYEKQTSVEPYVTREGDALTTALQSVIDGDLTLDDLNTNIVDVKTWETEGDDGYPAIKENCVIEITSYGGDTSGYQIPFNVHRTGVKVAGYFDPTTKAFTPSSDDDDED